MGWSGPGAVEVRWESGGRWEMLGEVLEYIVFFLSHDHVLGSTTNGEAKGISGDRLPLMHTSL